MKYKPQHTKAHNASEADYSADIKKKSAVIPKFQSKQTYARKTYYVLYRTRNGDTKQKQQ